MFRRLFADGACRCSDMRKEGAYPWPHSALECKEHGEDRGHPRWDTLLAAGAGKPPSPEFECHCGAKLRPPSGYGRYCIRGDERNPLHHAEKIDEMRMAHVQIDIRRGKAMNGQLYSAAVLTRGQKFMGFAEVPVSASDYFEKTALGPGVMWLGRGRTRGQGEVSLSVEKADPPDENEFAGQVAKLNRKAGEYAVLRNQLVFSCTLLSPAFILDRWLLPKAEPEASDFADVQGYSRLAAFGRQTGVTGWHSASALPKAEMIAWEEGSCFLFGRPIEEAEREAETQRLAAELRRAQEAGAGERVEEGFGEVAFCHPIHEELAWQTP
jgi:hypothetical protein